jgi:hypothetical protein
LAQQDVSSGTGVYIAKEECVTWSNFTLKLVAHKPQMMKEIQPGLQIPERFRSRLGPWIMSEGLDV